MPSIRRRVRYGKVQKVQQGIQITGSSSGSGAGFVMRKRVRYLCFGLLLIVLLYFVVDFLNQRSRQKSECKIRQIKLTYIQKGITEYINRGNSTPDNLYIYCNEIGCCSQLLRWSGLDDGDYDSILNNPDLFEQQVAYSILKDNKRWYVREKQAGHYFKDVFVIDDNGNMYVVKEY